MESKVYFDLNGQDESVVVAKIISTDDVRDKVARRFKDGLGYESNLALVRILPDEDKYSALLSESQININVAGNKKISVLEIKTIGDGKEKTVALCRELCDVQLQLLAECIDVVIFERSYKQKSDGAIDVNK